MMLRVSLLLLLALTLAWPGQAEETSPIKSVEIKVYPDQGSAFCRFEADGTTHGGHVSPPPVRVYEDSGKVDRKVVEQIWMLAERLKKQDVSRQSPGNSYVLVTHENGTVEGASWPFGKQPTDPTLRELSDLLMKHRVGGW